MTSTLIRNTMLFDGTGAAPYPSDVLIEDGRFGAVGSALAAESGDVVDAGGRFAMPGMIDCHVHATLFGEQGLTTYARLGVTTVKDLGGVFDATLDLRRRSQAGEVPGARVLAVGSFVEGDPASWGGLLPVEVSGMQVHRTEDDVDRTIARALDAQVDGIKLYAGLPPPLLRRAIDRVAGAVPVTGHLTATTASEAVDAGIGGLEHLQLTLYRDLAPPEHALAPADIMSNPAYWLKVRNGWGAIDPGDARPLVERMSARGVVMVPTLVLGARTDLDFSPEEEAAFTEEQRTRLAARAGFARPATEELERSAANMLDVVSHMHDGGVTVLPGTDCGAVGVPPGYGYHIELALMAQAMPAHDVLMSATSRAAAWLCRDDIGVVAPGRRADLALLDASPLDDIANTRRIAAVYMDGQRVDGGKT